MGLLGLIGTRGGISWSPTALDAYLIEKSIRFDDGDSHYLNRTPSSATTQNKWTWSGWVKRGHLGTSEYFFGTAYNSFTDGDYIRFMSDDTLDFGGMASSSFTYELITTAAFKDTSAWYHIVIAVDTTQSTSTDRIKLYVNGLQITDFSTSNYPSLNYNTTINSTQKHALGRAGDYAGQYFDGYMSDVHFIDGQQLTPSDFGGFDSTTAIWHPKKYSGTYGPLVDQSKIWSDENITSTGGIWSDPPNSESIVKTNLFDGSLSTYASPYSSGTVTIPFGQTFSGTKTYSVYWYTRVAGETIEDQSGNTLYTSTTAEIKWHEFTGTDVSSLKFTANGSVNSSNVYAIKVGGKWLIDSGLTVNDNSFYLKFNGTDLGEDSSGNGNSLTVNNLIADGGTEDYAGSISGNPYLPLNAFTPSYINSYINTSTFAVTNVLWGGAYESSTATSHVFTPSGGLPVTSSLIVYFGAYNNNVVTITLLITYTDSSTETDTFDSSTNVHMKAFTASNAAGRTIQSIQVSGAVNSFLQFGGFVVDGEILKSYNYDTDASTDTPTNYGDTDSGVGGELGGNYCTLNPLAQTEGAANLLTMRQGNLELVSTGGWVSVLATMPIPSTGKWYFEGTIKTDQNRVHWYSQTGFGPESASYANSCVSMADAGDIIEYWPTTTVTNVLAAGTCDIGETAGWAIDIDNWTYSLYVNGVVTSLSNRAIPMPEGTQLWPICSNYSLDYGYFCYNFGQRKFQNPAPSGYKCLCTQNLPDPTIVDPSKYFAVHTFESTNSESSVISGLNFSPDMVWGKSRDQTYAHQVVDIVRGGEKVLRPHVTTAESDYSSNPSVSSWNSDGITGSTNFNINYLTGNRSVAWLWDAGTANTVDSSYNGDHTWSNGLVSANGNYTGGYEPDKAFDLVRSDGTAPDQADVALTYTHPESVTVTALEVRIRESSILTLPDGTNISITGHGGSGTSTDVWETVAIGYGFSFSGSNSITITGDSGNYSYLDGLKINGKILVDTVKAPSVVVGGLNSSIYNQDQLWTTGWSQSTAGTYLSGSGITGMTPDLMFNGDLASVGCIPAGQNGSYAFGSSVTFTPNGSTGIPCSTLVIKAVKGGSTTVLEINGVDCSSQVDTNWVEHTITMPAGETHLKTFKITADSGSDYIQVGYIIVNGARIIDSDVTGLTNIPTIASTYRANPTAGFSAITYTGAGSNATIAHGLAEAPAFIVSKSRTNASGPWYVYHQSLGYTQYLKLDDASVAATYAVWPEAPTSSVFTGGSDSVMAASDYLAYAWSEVPGYSKFGTWTGNGAQKFIYTGFKPAMVFLKQTNGGNDWYIFDDKRASYLVPSNNAAEPGTDFSDHELLSNGFSFNTNNAAVNGSSDTYVFCAWAKSPFKYARASVGPS